MTDLLPCPFCGSSNLRYEFCGSQGYIECNECCTQGPCDERAADPICDPGAACDAWNRRAALAQPEPQGPSETAWALAQLLDGVQRHDLPNMTGLSDSDCDRIWAARPAIKPVPVAPTNLDAEFRSWYGDRYGRSYFGGIALVECVEWTQFVLARWGRPAIKPVPVSERLPGPEDCDAKGRCWFGTPSSCVMAANWVHRKAEHRRSWDTHWAPHWALPVPAPANTINQNNY